MPTSSSFSPPALPLIHWNEGEEARTARWRSERGAPPPKRVMIADDTMNADTAYRLACEGTGLLWRGDFQNARQLLQALVRRVDAPVKETKTTLKKRLAKEALAAAAPAEPGAAFHLYRQAQSQRARVLAMLLLPFNADYGVPLRRAPDAREACAEVWGAADLANGDSVASMRELLGFISAHEWRKKGVLIDALGKEPNNRIYPHYGVYSPARGEYLGLIAKAPLPPSGDAPFLAFDIGTGTGVIAALITRRASGRASVRIVATDSEPRALACARDNIARLGLSKQVKVEEADMFPTTKTGKAQLIVCNPPWLPARASSPIEHAVYDEGSRMLLAFLNGLGAHLAPAGEGWLILSDLAEHLGLRTRAELLAAITAANLKVIAHLDAKPVHSKAGDSTDPLHAARAAEVTSLWRLGVA